MLQILESTLIKELLGECLAERINAFFCLWAATFVDPGFKSSVPGLNRARLIPLFLTEFTSLELLVKYSLAKLSILIREV